MASSSSSVPVAQAETFPDGTTDYVPIRKKNYDIRKPRRFPAVLPKKGCAGLHADSGPMTDITETPITWGNWYQHVNWLNTYFIIVVPLIGLISSYWVDLQLKTAIFAVAYYYFAGLGISMSAAVGEGKLRVINH